MNLRETVSAYIDEPTLIDNRIEVDGAEGIVLELSG